MKNKRIYSISFLRPVCVCILLLMATISFSVYILDFVPNSGYFVHMFTSLCVFIRLFFFFFHFTSVAGVVVVIVIVIRYLPF